MEGIMSLNSQSQGFMTAMAKLMQRGLESNEGMRTLAAAIAPTIEQEIKRKEISSLLLARHDLPKGERPVYQIRKKVKAHWISKDGDALIQEVGKDELEIPTHRILSSPSVDISVLKNGNIGTLHDLQNAAAEEIRKEVDKRTLRVISAAVPPQNTVDIVGNTLTQEALTEAMSLIEDQEVAVKYIVMRGRRFADMKGWPLDPTTQLELRQKGIIKNYGTGSLLTTSAAEVDEVLILPDVEIGKMPVREKLVVDPLELKTQFKVGWMVWQELGQGVTRPNLIAKIRLTG